MKDSKFFDSSGSMFRAQIGQAPVGVYDTSDNIVVGTNPDVRKAWDTTVTAIQAGLSANIAAWTPEWNAGFAKGSFATIVCPAWMTAYIEGQAKDAAGSGTSPRCRAGPATWVARTSSCPGRASTPRPRPICSSSCSARRTRSRSSRTRATSRPCPGSTTTRRSRTFHKPFFNNAPMGKIFSAAALALKPQYEGPRAGDVMAAIGQGLGRVEQGKQHLIRPGNRFCQMWTD